MNYPWLRLYSEIANDKKITRICLKTKQSKALVLGVVTMLLCMANESPERGKLLISKGIPYTTDEILFECGLGEEGKSVIEAFLELGILHLDGDTFTLINWEKRQAPSGDSTERTRRYRERKQQRERNGNATEPSQERHGDVTLMTHKEEDKESDKESKPTNNKPIADPEKWNNTNKKIVGDKFFELTQLKKPTNKKTVGAWWGWLYEIFEIAGKDAAETCRIMAIVVENMRTKPLPISSPKSLVNLSRTVASGQELSGEYRNNGPARASPQTPTLTPEQQAIVNRLNESGR